MAEDALTKLWHAYKNEGCTKAKEELVAHYAYVVRHIVSRVLVGLPTHVESDELLSYATLGLLEALDRFDPERGFRFETFSASRIKGAIMDGMRANDWVSRFMRSRIKEMERVFARLQQELGRDPEDDEMCQALQISLVEYIKLQQNAGMAVVFSLDESVSFEDGELHLRSDTVQDVSAEVDSDLLVQDEKAALVKAIDSLPEREKILVSLYYYEGLTLKEAGQVLGVTESRASQMHSKAILRLRAAMVND